MTVLEFISSLKWPVALLAVFFWIARALKKNPGFRNWLKRWLENRDVRGKIGFAELEALHRGSEVVQAAVATDEELAELARSDQSGADDNATTDTTSAVTALRREVVEEVIRTSAQWGWDTAHMGFRNPPDPQVEWTDDGRPVIRFGMGAPDPISRTIVMDNQHVTDISRRAADRQGAIRRLLDERGRTDGT
ncbi:hypothetical protein [Streptomyces sp. NPDC020983]|uniref:hypothetical protein n=1 Tax=Streptomyces sp. NPDC020983 TaxID=3365106 RepID=UPI0037B847FF